MFLPKRNTRSSDTDVVVPYRYGVVVVSVAISSCS